MSTIYDTESIQYSDVAPALIPRRSQRLDKGLSFLEADLDRHRFHGDFPSPRSFQGDYLWDSFVTEDPEFRERLSVPDEVFSTLLIAESLDAADRRPRSWPAIVRRIEDAFTEQGLVHFFADRNLLPADLDCTALALTFLMRHGGRLPLDPHRIVDCMAANANEAGVVCVYVTPDPERGSRVDPAVCANVLYAAYSLGREVEFESSEKFVEEFLRSDACMRGTRYYPSPEIFFLFLSRLVADFEGPRTRFQVLLRQRLQERLGLPTSNILERASRVIVSSRLNVDVVDDLNALVGSQRADGSWPAAACFRYGRTARFFGSDALSTAFAMHALAVAQVGGGISDLRMRAMEEMA